jgi:hypothetical protein
MFIWHAMGSLLEIAPVAGNVERQRGAGREHAEANLVGGLSRRGQACDHGDKKCPSVGDIATKWPACDALLKRRGSLMAWLGPKWNRQVACSRHAGRSGVFSNATIQSFLTLKCVFGFGLRQTTGLAANLLKLAQRC